MPQIGVKAGQADRPRRRRVTKRSGGGSAQRGFNVAASLARQIEHHPRRVTQPRPIQRAPRKRATRRHPSQSSQGFNAANALVREVRKHPNGYTPTQAAGNRAAQRAFDLAGLLNRELHSPQFDPHNFFIKLNHKDAFQKFLGKDIAAPGLRVLSQLSRPVHGIAGAADAFATGKGPGDAAHNFSEGVLHNKPYTFSDVLKHLGAPAGVAAVGGFVGDVALDPTTYATFGTGTIGKEVLAKAAYKSALDKGATEAVARKAAKNAYKEGAQRAGLTVGARAKVPFGPRFRASTSGRATGAVARKTGTRKVLQGARNTRLAQATGKALAPDFRPAGVSAETHAAYLSGKRSRAGAQRAEVRRLENRVQAVAKHTSPQESRQVVHALETGQAHTLPAHLQPVARTAQHEFNRMAAREKLVARRTNYVPHVAHEDLGQVGARFSRGGRKNPHAKARKVKGTIADVNARAAARGDTPLFSENLANVMAARGAVSAHHVGEAGFLEHLASKVGRPYHPGEGIGKDEMVYSIGHDSIAPLERKRAGQPMAQVDTAKAAKAAKGGERLVVLPRVIGAAETVARDPARQAGDFTRWFDRVMGGMKTGLTVLNVPAYDLRNMYGDLFNAYLAGTSTADVIRGFRLSAQHVGATRAERSLGKTATRDPLLAEARKMGVIDAGHAGGELYQRARGTSRTGTKVLGRGPHPVERLRGIGTARENSTRLATYLSARKRGLTPTEARDWVNQHHFDYTELTPSENSLRRVFPFYTWTARNTRLQVSKLFHEPGKATTVQKALEETAKAAGFGSYADFASQLQVSQQRGLPIPLKVGGTVFPLFAALPASDLNRIPGTFLFDKPVSGHAIVQDLGQFMDMTGQNVNPIAKAVVELGANHSFFFGRPIYQTANNPKAPHWVPGPSVNVGPVHLNLNTTQIKDPQSGGMVGAMPAWLDYLLRLTPQGGLVTQLGTPVRGSRGQTAATKVASQLSGVRIGNFDPKQLKVSRLYQQVNQLEGRKQDLVDQNKAGPQGHRSPAYQRILDQERQLRQQIYKVDASTKRAVKRGSKPPSGRSGGSGLGSGLGSGSLGSGL